MPRYQSQIETTQDGQIWQGLDISDPEDYHGTAADYGRDALGTYLDDASNDIDIDGNSIETDPDNVRIRVWDADHPDMALGGGPGRVDGHVVIDSTDPAPAEVAAVEAAREQALRTDHAHDIALEALNDALLAARRAGHGANRMADLAYPAVSRPIALAAMRSAAPAESAGSALTASIRALGGTWDTERAVAALRDRGHVFADQRAAEKRARQILRDLADLGLVEKSDPDRAVYRTTEQ